MTYYDVDAFTKGYIEAALFTASDDAGEPLDRKYFYTDISPESIARMAKECAEFQHDNESLLTRAYETPGYDAIQAGLDFLFTRNGEGVGYWDRDLGEVGDLLTQAAKGMPEAYLLEHDEIDSDGDTVTTLYYFAA